MVSDRYLSRHKVTTLKSYSKKRLIDLLLGIEKETDKTTARVPQTQSDSEAIVNDILKTFEEIKKFRTNEDTKSHSLTKGIFKTNAIKLIDKALSEEKLSTNKFNKTLAYTGFALLIVDTFIGFDNVPKLFEKVREKIQRKKDQKQESQTQTTVQHQFVHSK